MLTRWRYCEGHTRCLPAAVNTNLFIIDQISYWELNSAIRFLKTIPHTQYRSLFVQELMSYVNNWYSVDCIYSRTIDVIISNLASETRDVLKEEPSDKLRGVIK